MQPNAGGKILEEALANIRRSRNVPTPRRQLSAQAVEILHQAGAAVPFPLENPGGRRLLQARDESLSRHRRDVTDPQARPTRHDLSCAALAHTEELLDRRAVEVTGCHGPQGAEDFFKSMKPGGLGGHSIMFC